MHAGRVPESPSTPPPRLCNSRPLSRTKIGDGEAKAVGEDSKGSSRGKQVPNQHPGDKTRGLKPTHTLHPWCSGRVLSNQLEEEGGSGSLSSRAYLDDHVLGGEVAAHPVNIHTLPYGAARVAEGAPKAAREAPPGRRS